MSGPPNRTPPSRRTFLTAAVAGLGAAAVGTAAHGDALQVPAPARVPRMTGYAPDGTAGLTRAFPLSQVKLLTGAFEQNRRRNTSYLLFLDADRLLRSFRLNYGLKAAAEPCGGWEAPAFGGPWARHRAPAVRPGADLGQHREPRGPGQGPLHRPGAGGPAGPGRCGRVQPGLPVGLPRGLLRPAGGRPVRLVAVLHDPQVPGWVHRPVPAGRGRDRARGGHPPGRLGGLAYRPPQLRPHAAGPGGGVRRAARSPGQPVHDHRQRPVPDHRPAVLPRTGAGPDGARAGPAGRAAGQRDRPEGHLVPAAVGRDRERPLPRPGHELLGDGGPAPQLRHRRGQRARALRSPGRHRGRAVQLHLRELRHLQPAEADPAAALPPARPD